MLSEVVNSHSCTPLHLIIPRHPNYSTRREAASGGCAMAWGGGGAAIRCGRRAGLEVGTRAGRKNSGEKSSVNSGRAIAIALAEAPFSVCLVPVKLYM